MDITKILSGHDLVAKGATKTEATLPEIGLKNVCRNNTWLEDKQIQSALELRKQLVEVQRIEKSGVLSHGHWREDLTLVEVTKKVGGHWQYLGHNVGKTLFLYPEEALFLMEVNCLCLKHNDVLVSLQQAYNILLQGKIMLYQYKVYAFLSRLGYRVYRHEQLETITNEKNISINANDSKSNDTETVQSGNKETEKLCNINTKFIMTAKNEYSAQLEEDAVTLNKTLTEYIQTEQTGSCSGTIVDDVIRENNKSDKSTSSYRSKKLLNPCIDFSVYRKQNKHKKNTTTKILQRLKCRQLKPCNNEVISKYFEGIPELSNNNIVTIKIPEKRLIPDTINSINTNYKINLENVRSKRVRPPSTETNIYSSNDEANGSHVRGSRNTSANNRLEFHSFPPTQNVRFASRSARRPADCWSARRQPFDFFTGNMFYQRPFLPSWVFSPNFSFFPRHYAPFWRPNFNMNNRNTYTQNASSRKKMRKAAKRQHLEGIYKLAYRLKRIILNGHTEHENIYSLQRLINTYNTRYKTKVRLDETFDIIIDETIVDTIELDDDSEPSRKRRRVRNDDSEENLTALKELASRLRELQSDGKCSSKHRRAFSKLLKTFNKSYSEDYYLDEDYELAHRNLVDLDSTDDSDTDCILEGAPNAATEGKKLKNPFNILKRLSETPLTDPSSSVDQNLSTECDDRYGESILNTFSEGWLPPENDFGRPEIVTQDSVNVDGTETKREEFLYDFLKIQTYEYDNWLDLKRSYFNSIDAAIAEFRGDLHTRTRTAVGGVAGAGGGADAAGAGGEADAARVGGEADAARVGGEADAAGARDGANAAAASVNLSIINNEKSAAESCNLAIDFDVYERSVKNFKKTNRPTPHFRIVCLHERSAAPAGAQLAALPAQDAPVVLAVLGVGALSFLRMQPCELSPHESGASDRV